MVLEIMSGISVLKSLIEFGISAREAWKEEGFGDSEINALAGVLNASEGIWTLKEKKDENLELGALHLALVTRCFGHAIGRFQVYTEQLASKSRPLFGGTPVTSQQPQVSQQQIEQLLKSAASASIEPGVMPSGRLELDLIESLTGSPLNSQFYRFLWEAFFAPPAGEPPILTIEKGGVLEFERYFLLAWGQAVASTNGERLRQYMNVLGQDYKPRLVQELLVRDVSDWDSRHTFGNIKQNEDRGGDPLPFMPLNAMYIEPFVRAADNSADQSELALSRLKSTLEEHKIVILQADFGMGKSLTSRMLACSLAKEFLNTSKPSHDVILPIYIRCVDDLKPQESLRSTVQRSNKRHADALGFSLKLDDTALNFPLPKQRALFLIDGLDEVHLGARGLESFFERLKDEATDKHRFVVFSRPGAIPSEMNLRALKGVPILELLAWSDQQVDLWLERWSKVKGSQGPTREEIRKQGLFELAKTPILLLLIAHTWKPEEKDKARNKAELFERFFQSIARGKHEADRDEHPALFQASMHLKDRLVEKEVLPREIKEPDAMLWLMSRVAWEDTRLRQNDKEETLDDFQIQRILRDELELKSNTPEVIGTIQVGLLLALQANLQSGRAGSILFGHKSFREFLVARYWADRLRALSRSASSREAVEKSLLGGRLLGREDRSFEFLMDILNADSGQKGPPGQLFDFSDKDRETLCRWAEDRFQDKRWVSRDGAPPTLQSDHSAWLREAAIAIGSYLRNSKGVRIRDHKALKNLYAWFWFRGEIPIIKARRVQAAGAYLSDVNFFEADLSGADLSEAVIRDSRLFGANLRESNLRQADLSNSSLYSADLSGADLSDAALTEVALSDATLTGTIFNRAILDQADLSDSMSVGAFLSGADLSNAEFRNADLGDADLRETDLRGADLRRAKLEEANLRSANLRRVDLRRATLAGADLRAADLRGANICGAYLIGADLRGANLRGVRYDCFTSWENIDASAVGAVCVDETTRRHRAIIQEEATLARQLQERALEVSKRDRGATHSDTLVMMEGLAEILRSLGEMERVRQIQEQIFDIQQSTRGLAHPYTLKIAEALAETIRHLGDDAALLRLQQRVIESSQIIDGSARVGSLRAIERLATTLRTKGELERAKRLQEHILSIYQQQQGPTHPHTLRAMEGLAKIHRDMKEATLARQLQERILDICIRDSSELHPRTLKAVVNLAETLRALDDQSTERQLRERILEAARLSFDAKQQSTWSTSELVADTLRSMGDYAGALRIQKSVLEASQSENGPEHAITLSVTRRLGKLLREMGSIAEAREVQERVLESYHREHGADNSLTMSAMEELVDTLRAGGDFESAQQVQERVLDASQLLNGATHSDTQLAFQVLKELQAARDQKSHGFS